MILHKAGGARYRRSPRRRVELPAILQWSFVDACTLRRDRQIPHAHVGRVTRGLFSEALHRPIVVAEIDVALGRGPLPPQPPSISARSASTLRKPAMSKRASGATPNFGSVISSQLCAATSRLTLRRSARMPTAASLFAGDITQRVPSMTPAM